MPPPQLQLDWIVSPLVQALPSSHAVPGAGVHTVAWHSGSVQTFPATKVPPPVQVVAVEKFVQVPAADLQHPGASHVPPPVQAGSFSILTTFSPQPATDRIVQSFGSKVLPSCPL